MSVWAELAKDVLKLWERPSFTFSVWLVAAITLVGFAAFPSLEEYPTVFWIAAGTALLFFVFWLVQIVLLWSDKHETLAHLDSLTPEEAEALLQAVVTRSQTIELPHNRFQVATAALVKKGLLKPISFDFKTASFTVPRFVWLHINKAHVMAMLGAQTARQA